MGRGQWDGYGSRFLDHKSFQVTGLLKTLVKPMSTSHDVPLPISQPPRFPDRCIVCEAPGPGGKATVRFLGDHRTQSWGMDLIDMAAGITPGSSGVQMVTLEPPACPRCARQASRKSLAIVVAKYVGALAGVAGFVALAAIGWIYVGFVPLAAGLILPVVWELTNPPPLGATMTGDRVIYEFRSARCAQEFAALNLQSQAE